MAADSSVPTSTTTGASLPRVTGMPHDDGRVVRVDVGRVQRPGELELDLLVLLAALVLDRELGADGDLEALTGDLDAERLVLLQGVGQPPQLGHQLRGGVDALDVTSTLCHVPEHGRGTDRPAHPRRVIAAQGSCGAGVTGARRTTRQPPQASAPRGMGIQNEASR